VRGEVIEFDEPRGLGVVRADDGATYRFHCTAIADGTRTIGVGAVVEFELTPRLGEYEATALRSGPPSG
jgi:cold shock CspA family protein